MIQTLYRGSVKDLKGPVRVQEGPEVGDACEAIVFEYTDAYSVFDWGKMPDLLPHKGEALATLAADFFEKLERAETWKEFSRSSDALGLRKGNRFGSAFNEVGEDLQSRGLRTHYYGVLLGAIPEKGEIQPTQLAQVQAPIKSLLVRRVAVVKPLLTTVLGRALPDYHPTRNAPLPRLVPLEVVFRFSLPEGSSMLERVARDPGYLASLGFADSKAELGAKWDFPVLELFTKLETSDRLVSLTEALAMSGLSASQLQDLLFRTAWVAGCLRWLCGKAGIELADGKLEWGVDEHGHCQLVDAIGPDELRLLKDGVQLSKEFLRQHYRDSIWYETIQKAKDTAKAHGISEWKKAVPLPPPPLPPEKRELASQVYLALTQALTGRQWFPEAWSLDRVVAELKGIGSKA
ncbi:phosphoribosylaminoimidazolesuccinocarboxamide synthase [Bdellovibrionota bacterium FG-1]